jgi:hydroxypyruvate isomerase
MKRRKFLQTTGLAGLASSLSPLAGTPDNTKNKFRLLYAPHFGMFENNAGKDLVDQIQFMNDNGFMALEDNGMMGRDISTQEAIANRMTKLNMKMGVFVVSFDNWPPKSTLTTGNMDWRNKFLDICKQAVEVAKRVNAKYMTVVPGNSDRSLPMGIQMANVIESLRRASDIFEPHNLTMVLEPLSDNPDLFMRYSDQTYLLCKAVNSPSCKILFDMWHMQRNEGRMMYNIDQVWNEIGYFQIGDEPGRKEPGTGEINYKNLFRYIHDRAMKENKEFILGMEHGNMFPGKDGELKLIQAYIDANTF